MKTTARWSVLFVLVSVGCGGSGGEEPDDDGGTDGGVDAGPEQCVSDDDCDDGTFCNGLESCDPEAPDADARGCVAGSEPCGADESCDEDTGACLGPCETGGDADGDGHDSVACGGDDCDDTDPARFPGNAEVCDPDGHDEDCDPMTVGGRDQDNDGFIATECCNTRDDGVLVCGEDCNDGVRNVNPLAPEVCEGLDNDCDGTVDEDVKVSGFADADHDLHGDPDSPIEGCPGTPGLSPVADDCDDTDPSVHGAQPELCNGTDDDCDGEVDEGGADVVWYADDDGDGFGNAASGTVTQCSQPSGYSLLPGDCDDDDPNVSPATEELCDAADNDCNGRADFEVATGDLEDDDGDGVPDAACAPEGVAADCDDTDVTVHEGAPELVDGVDNDCDGETDEACEMATWYPDADGDGWGLEGGEVLRSCELQDGYVTRAGDCDDEDTERNPGAREVCNGVDDDCDGETDETSGGLCYFDHALGACVDGGCEVQVCEVGWGDCDADGATGCETNLHTSLEHCGSCGNICPLVENATRSCDVGECALSCAVGFDDCDSELTNGCEIEIRSDVDNCGACGDRCSNRPNATRTCEMSACGISCDAGYDDCNGSIEDGCEIQTDRDRAHCGACSDPCPLATDACVGGICEPSPFPSDGSEGPLDVTGDLVLTPGRHDFTTITVASGATVTTTGSGVLDLRATGAVLIEGVIDVSGGDGAISATQASPGGGDTGNPLGDAPTSQIFVCDPPGGGGLGAPGQDGVGDPDGSCSLGGQMGGGMGGRNTPALGGFGGGGGGGYAGGGGGGGIDTAGGDGASTSGATGGTGGPACEGGAGGVAAAPYGGGDGEVQPSSACVGGGGGGSIGADAAADLEVTTTFRPGSAGGGGGGRAGSAVRGGAGGGGAGGALRISTPLSITITSTGALRADGGAGAYGGSASSGGGGSGGGGSGGVIYLSSPAVYNRGEISAVGGSGGTNSFGSGGDGGLGRVRISVVEADCEASSGVWAPALESGCAPSPSGGTDGYTYVAPYPD